MASKDIPKYRLEQFEDMVRSKLKPLQSVAEAVEERLRIKVERQVAKETGLNKIQKEIDKLNSQLGDLRTQKLRVVGDIDRHWNNDSSHYNYTRDSPFAKEVEARMATANGVIGRWRDLKSSAIEKVRLLNAPGDVQALLTSIGDEVKELMVKMLKEHKALPVPTTEA